MVNQRISVLNSWKNKVFPDIREAATFLAEKKSGSLWFENTSGRKKKVMQFFSENSIEEK